MKIKTIRDEDYSSYKEVSMLIAFPHCSFKCCTDIGRSISMCQNSPIARMPTREITPEEIFERYNSNVITHSIVCGGLEPMDSFGDLFDLISVFRTVYQCDDPFIIYTGYDKREISTEILLLSAFKNIIVKFGRYIPSQPSHFDALLGVVLASPNQYAENISFPVSSFPVRPQYYIVENEMRGDTIEQ